MDLYDMLGRADELAEELISEAHGQRVKVEELCLDPRAGYEAIVCPAFICTKKERDRSLQYYGGFEYVDQEQRFAGDDEDERVREHIEIWQDKQA